MSAYTTVLHSFGACEIDDIQFGDGDRAIGTSSRHRDLEDEVAATRHLVHVGAGGLAIRHGLLDEQQGLMRCRDHDLLEVLNVEVASRVLPSLQVDARVIQQVVDVIIVNLVHGQVNLSLMLNLVNHSVRVTHLLVVTVHLGI